MDERYELTGNSYAIIDMEKLKSNVSKLKAHLGDGVKLLPVLKGNTCGHGLEEIAEYLITACGLDMLCVGHTIEAERLRSHGIQCDILVLGGTPFSNIPFVVRQNITTTVGTLEYAKQLSDAAVAQNIKAKVHVKINTGLNRMGVKPGNDLEKFLREISTLPGLAIEGAYTHFANAADKDISITQEQGRQFEIALAQIKTAGIELKYCHAANSVAAIRFPQYHYNMVRSLVAIIGYDGSPEEPNRLGLEPILCWKAFVAQVNRVKAGERYGYGLQCTALRDMKIAISSFGYADGYPDELAGNGGYVVIRGEKAEILSLNMDQGYIDVTHIDDVQVGDDILLLGKDGGDEISLLSFSKNSHNSGMFLLSAINQRVRRVFKY